MMRMKTEAGLLVFFPENGKVDARILGMNLVRFVAYTNLSGCSMSSFPFIPMLMIN